MKRRKRTVLPVSAHSAEQKRPETHGPDGNHRRHDPRTGVEIVAVPFSALLGPEVLVTDVDLPTRLNEGQVFDLAGRFELDTSIDGWLVAAEEFQISSDDRQWPESSLRAEASTASDGSIVVLDVRAVVDVLLQHLLQRRRQDRSERHRVDADVARAGIEPQSARPL